jgi:hypothetical protein
MTVPLGGAGRTKEGFPSIGVADWAYTDAVAPRIDDLHEIQQDSRRGTFDRII